MKKLTVLLALAVALVAGAEEIEINGVGAQRAVALRAGDVLRVQGTNHTVTVTGQGGVVEVNGTGQTVSLTGRAEHLEVNGTGNKVRVDAELQHLEVNGVGNTVTYVNRKGRSLPALQKAGVNNEVVTVEP